MTKEQAREVMEQIKLLQSQRDQLEDDIDDAFSRIDDYLEGAVNIENNL